MNQKAHSLTIGISPKTPAIAAKANSCAAMRPKNIFGPKSKERLDKWPHSIRNNGWQRLFWGHAQIRVLHSPPMAKPCPPAPSGFTNFALVVPSRIVLAVAADGGLCRGLGLLRLTTLDAHANGPRCAQISGPTVGARQRSPAVDLLVANEGWVIVLCQDRSRRRRWPKASLYKGLSPSHARPTDGHVGVCPARGCPRETRQSAPGWWVRKMSTPWVHSRERQGLQLTKHT